MNLSESSKPQRALPPVNRKLQSYAFERSLGLPPAEACRRAGGKVDNGHATRWERSTRVQAWISHFRSLGQTEEMLAAKRERVEGELLRIGTANMDDFVKLVPSGECMIPVLDLTRLNALPEDQRRDAMAAVKTVKYTENGPTFELHPKLDALNQLRDMHGFKSVTKTALTDPTGTESAPPFVVEIVKFADAARPKDQAPA